MALDLNNGYAELRDHIGHEIECVGYGGDVLTARAAGEQPFHANVALECVTCGTVLLDFDEPKELP